MRCKNISIVLDSTRKSKENKTRLRPLYNPYLASRSNEHDGLSRRHRRHAGYTTPPPPPWCIFEVPHSAASLYTKQGISSCDWTYKFFADFGTPVRLQCDKRFCATTLKVKIIRSSARHPQSQGKAWSWTMPNHSQQNSLWFNKKSRSLEKDSADSNNWVLALPILLKFVISVVNLSCALTLFWTSSCTQEIEVKYWLTIIVQP